MWGSSLQVDLSPGLPRLFKRNSLFGFWLAIGMGFLLAWGTKWPQYVVTVLPPWCLSASQALSMLAIEPLARLIRRRFPQLAEVNGRWAPVGRLPRGGRPT